MDPHLPGLRPPGRQATEAALTEIDWRKVETELRRLATAQEELVRDPYKHQTVKQAAATVGAIFGGIASAIEEGMKP